MPSSAVEKQNNSESDSRDNINTASHSPTTPPRTKLENVLLVEDIGSGQIRHRHSILQKLRNAELWLDKKTNFEPMGAERIPEDCRNPPRTWNMVFLWFSLIMAPATITFGVLGPLLGLSILDASTILLVGTISGSTLPAFTATLSPLTGLRQIAVARYSFGVWGSKICGVLNIVVQVAYCVFGCVFTGQLLTAVSGGSLPLAVGVVLAAVIAFGISFLGFRVLQIWESVAWIGFFALLCVEWGQIVAFYPVDIRASDVKAMDRVAAGLTYFALVFGGCVAWCSLSGDYYVHYPRDVDKVMVFFLTLVGLVVPNAFVGCLGCYLGGLVMSDSVVGGAYATGGFGEAILVTMRPSGWSKFVCVCYAFSTVSTTAVGFYSSTLTCQLFGRHFMAIPRFIWNIVFFLICIAISLGIRNNFQSMIQSFVSILGYWTIPFGLILLLEHFLFRPRLGGYDLDNWQDSKKMPLGVAAVGTLLLALGLAFVGMKQVWFVGPLAQLIGDGGDVGDYIATLTTVIVYPISRWLEIEYSSGHL